MTSQCIIRMLSHNNNNHQAAEVYHPHHHSVATGVGVGKRFQITRCHGVSQRKCCNYALTPLGR